MDIHDTITDIMFHIFNDKELFEKLKKDIEDTSNKSKLLLEVRIPTNSSENDNYNVNMYKKIDRKDYLKNNLPKYKKVKTNELIEECSICLENYKENTYKRTLNCSHHFHKKCIDKWLKKCDEENIHCPMCRNQYSIPLEFVSNFNIQKSIN